VTAAESCVRVELIGAGTDLRFRVMPDPVRVAAAASRVPAWLRTVQHRLEGYVNGDDPTVRPLPGRVLAWLLRLIHADESMLRHLRTATSVDLLHPPELPPQQARELWSSMLRRGRRRHVFWLVVDAVIAPLSIVLAPLPGPNVVGYWILFRVVCHWLAFRGAARAQYANLTLVAGTGANVLATPVPAAGNGPS
jgi:hypothetical protein